MLAALAASRLPPHVEPARWWQVLGASTVPDRALVADLAEVAEPASLDSDAAGLHVLGLAHEVLRQDRRASGAVYTPPSLAAGLTALAVGDLRRPRILDPAVGGGAFLVAAAELLHARGVARAEVVGELLWGSDLDAGAVAVTRATLAWWSTLEGEQPTWPPEAHVAVVDGLKLCGELGRGGFDVVLGNPPFQGQLRTRTRRAPRPARVLEDVAAPRGSDAESVAVRYADSAVVFLAEACRLARPGGRVLLIQPQSVLAARDAGPARAVVADRAVLRGVWVGEAHEFAAAVRVWAPLLEVRPDAGPRAPSGRAVSVPRWLGADVVAAAPVSWPGGPQPDPTASWAPLIADLLGGVTLDLEQEGHWAGRLGERAQVTAGFRQHFYGLAPVVSEAPPGVLRSGTARLVTVGLIDPLHLQWGVRPARFAGRALARPVVDLSALRRGDDALAGWVAARLRPKVLVATQSAVVEAVVDTAGDLVPSTPVISVEPDDPDLLDALAAVLCAPPVTAWMLRRRAGSGLSGRAMRISAADVAAIPLPGDAEAWARGAGLVRRARGAATDRDASAWAAALAAAGRTMTEAYGFDPAHPVVAWWQGRLPPWREGGPA